MERLLARLAINSAAIALAIMGGCVVLVFLVIAFYLGMTELMAPWLAALTTAGAALVLSVLVVVIARLIARKAVPSAERARHRSAADLGETVGRQAHLLLSANSPLLMLGLTVLGFVLGFSPRLRRILMKLL
ncbi:MAG: hypothetical protein JO261_02980 [Alphaproteobacteria bacterium]|nr:hypothetical protein [Alphaproteobacteria bacterium]MBV9692643.1 hypothetical protein [Alphaproteobacteria bacterium]